MPGMANRAEEGTSICDRHIQAPGKLASLRNRQCHAGPLAARLCSPDKLSIWALMLQLSQLSGENPWLLLGKKIPPSSPKCGLKSFCFVLKRQ